MEGSKKAVRLAEWTAKKDFLEFCAAIHYEDVSCDRAKTASLDPPLTPGWLQTRVTDQQDMTQTSACSSRSAKMFGTYTRILLRCLLVICLGDAINAGAKGMTGLFDIGITWYSYSSLFLTVMKERVRKTFHQLLFDHGLRIRIVIRTWAEEALNVSCNVTCNDNRLDHYHRFPS
ncbi:hypothetical protein B0T21DRAFT_96012 [Apiosordaria backusii]|uniref:Uncharacterized protein n=1 Tax=Apiosordaria backusii TaxID=314023 RepID=A0AA40K3W4_9PEZI|nr:hypothetical protein B0T21DRAFT_96012 [Apiosordaria backusii]